MPQLHELQVNMEQTILIWYINIEDFSTTTLLTLLFLAITLFLSFLFYLSRFTFYLFDMEGVQFRPGGLSITVTSLSVRPFIKVYVTDIHQQTLFQYLVHIS